MEAAQVPPSDFQLHSTKLERPLLSNNQPRHFKVVTVAVQTRGGGEGSSTRKDLFLIRVRNNFDFATTFFSVVYGVVVALLRQLIQY